jgi:hypothetical protein
MLSMENMQRLIVVQILHRINELGYDLAPTR